MRWHLTLILLLSFLSSIAQKKQSFQLIFPNGDTKNINTNCKDSLCLQKEIQKTSLELLSEGYITLFTTTDSVKKVYTGKKFYLKNIDKGNINPLIYEKYWDIKSPDEFSPPWIEQSLESTLQHFENNGHPFASISLDSVKINNDTVWARLNIDLGPLVKIDSIIIKGNTKLNPQYLFKHLSLSPGDVYNESQLLGIPLKIEELSFTRLKAPPSVIFTTQSTKLTLELKKARTSNFRGIVGVQPDGEGKTSITGEADLLLHNNFYRAEKVGIRWKRVQSGSQNLNLLLQYPYIFNTSFGLNGTLDLFRQDTTFSNLNTELGLQFLLSTNHFYEAFIRTKNSNVLSQELTSSTSNASVKQTSYGLGYYVEKLDYSINPYKGFQLKVQGAAGKKITQNNSINLNPELDSLKNNTNEFTSLLEAHAYLPLTNRITLHLKVRDERLINEVLFENEFYRLGGLNSLRGFDEQSIFASSYTLASIEPKFILEKNAALFMFFDYMYYENKTSERFIYGNPFGFGLGLNFEARPGIFSFSYGLGQHVFYEDGIKKDNGFSLSSGKVHFGFISYF